ncbi:MAG: helix-turn-helix domain-containing protein [Acetatifactor sp.]|nr:helix-turn-helix domain-containing protein [Acetatifactor sp.]
MTLGEKIRRLRLLKDMTQHDLGRALGFSDATADSRVRKYERDVMAPKEDIRSKLAKILDADMSALSDIAICSDEDVMQVLFTLEQDYGVEISRTEENTTISFRNDSVKEKILLSYLYSWYLKRSGLPAKDSPTYEDSLVEYRKWQARFPYDLKDYWIDQEKKITKKFVHPVEKYKEEYLHTEAVLKVATLIRTLREMITLGLHVRAHIQPNNLRDSVLLIEVSVADMLDPSVQSTEAFTKFLFFMKSFEDYGILKKKEMSTSEVGTFRTYYLNAAFLMPLSEIVNTMNRYLSDNKITSEPTGDLESSMFEMKYEDWLRYYNPDINSFLS